MQNLGFWFFEEKAHFGSEHGNAAPSLPHRPLALGVALQGPLVLLPVFGYHGLRSAGMSEAPTHLEAKHSLPVPVRLYP